MPHEEVTKSVRPNASEELLNRGTSGIPPAVVGDSLTTAFLPLFERFVVAVELLAAGGGRRSNRSDDERIEIVLEAIRMFGKQVPTFEQLADKTGIKRSTLSGMTPVRDALREARARVKADRRAQGYKTKTGDFEAWTDPEDVE
jgi:hypothetical protein